MAAALGLLRRLGAARGLRCFSTEPETRSDILSKWLQEWMAVPRVVVAEGAEPPTALSWLRRRGPALPEAALHRLFRQESVRLYDPASQRVGRVSKARPLPQGSMLLLPKAAVAPAGSSLAGGGQQQRRREAAAALPPPAARLRAGQSAALRAALLHAEPDFLAVNKPAGLATQGGRGVEVSVDDLMGEALGHLPGVRPGELRLVHRLDRHTTGVLLIATSPDAAAWLAAAFRDGSGSGADGRRDRGPVARAPAQPASIRKTYWAVVARGRKEGDAPSSSWEPGGLSSRMQRQGGADRGAGWLPAAGTISLAVPSSRDPGQLLPALTRYRVLHQSSTSDLAWLQLSPQTGRKHQLRLHCARGLGAPVLGDGRYGALRSAAQEAALAAARAGITSCGSSSWGSSSGDPPLFLHCRSLEVRRPGGRRGAVQLTAPLPDSWRALLAREGWPLPDGPA